MISKFIASMVANMIIVKTGEQKSDNDYYDLSITSNNVIIQPKFNFYFGIVSIIIGIVAFILCFKASILGSIILGVLFVCLGVLMLIQFSNYKISYDTEKIIFTNTFGKTVEYPINSIEEFSYIENQVVTVKTQKGKLEFVPSCIGTQRFIFFMKETLKQYN